MSIFEKASWPFFEAAHGKGATDGIGGAVKRALDKKVSFGHDITHAKTAYNILTKTTSKIVFIYIEKVDIDNVFKSVDLTGLLPVPNTMTVHQVLSTNEANVIQFRKLSCFCNDTCTCFGLQNHDLTKKVAKKVRLKEKT